MQELITKSQKLTSLLLEYRAATTYQNCLYHLVRQPDRDNWYFLIDIKTEKIVKDGTPEKINGWLRIRGIKPEIVFNYSLLN